MVENNWRIDDNSFIGNYDYDIEKWGHVEESYENLYNYDYSCFYDDDPIVKKESSNRVLDWKIHGI